MNEVVEEWREGWGGITLSPALARKYMESETLFLCRIPAFNIIGESKITHISPNGRYAQITFYTNSYWVKISDMKVVDVLTPMERKKIEEKSPLTAGEMEKAIQAIKAYEKLQQKYPKKQ